MGKKEKLLQRGIELKILRLKPGTLFHMDTGEPAKESDDPKNLMRKPYNKWKASRYSRENQKSLLGDSFEPLREKMGKAKGGYIKKYAKGGGVRKAKRYS
jgi:hypothetical protein